MSREWKFSVVIAVLSGFSSMVAAQKETSMAMNELMTDRIQFRFADVLIALPLVKDKRIKVLAITSPKRSSIVHDVPSITEMLPGN